tara:strand:+ start:3505 stop:4443 length:939 start_codon:yes stop_codon:yes gene_type:complete
MNAKEAIKTLNEILGSHRKVSKNEYYFKCPACDHHKHKFAINLDKNAFHCWVCDYRGRNVRRIIRRFGSFAQLQAWDRLSGQADLTAFDTLFASEGPEPEVPVNLPEEFMSLANHKMPATGLSAISYLKNRSITKSDICAWKIGYCFSGEYEGRVIIPSFNKDGDLNYFVARNYMSNYKKYKNPTASKDIIFNELYVDWDSDVIIVEGVFDAIVAGNAVPILGSTIRSNSKLVRKIVTNDTPIFLALDPDAADKERSIIQTLLKYDIEMYKIDVSGYEDVGSMPKDVLMERKQKAKFIDRDDYLLRDMLSAI